MFVRTQEDLGGSCSSKGLLRVSKGFEGPGGSEDPGRSGRVR